jgi:hypothetical protein
MFVVVRDANRWEDDTSLQAYGLAVAMWRDAEHGGVYAELEANLEAVAEIAIEVQLDL